MCRKIPTLHNLQSLVLFFTNQLKNYIQSDVLPHRSKRRITFFPLVINNDGCFHSSLAPPIKIIQTRGSRKICPHRGRKCQEKTVDHNNIGKPHIRFKIRPTILRIENKIFSLMNRTSHHNVRKNVFRKPQSAAYGTETLLQITLGQLSINERNTVRPRRTNFPIKRFFPRGKANHQEGREQAFSYSSPRVQDHLISQPKKSIKKNLAFRT